MVSISIQNYCGWHMELLTDGMTNVDVGQTPARHLTDFCKRIFTLNIFIEKYSLCKRIFHLRKDFSRYILVFVYRT